MKVVFIVVALSLLDQSTTAETNLALNKPAFQYDERSGGVPERFVDGSNSGDGDATGTFGLHSCAATNAHTNTWFAVDLENVYGVKRVAIVNRADSADDANMRNFDVVVSNTKPPAEGELTKLDEIRKDESICHYRKESMPKGGPEELACIRYVEGRYVYIIFRENSGNIYLCELYVYGDLPTTTTTTTTTTSGRGNGSSPSLTTMILTVVVGVIYSYIVLS